MSGKGRPPSVVNCGVAGGVAFGIRGPSYQRTRSSRAHWTRSSWERVLLSSDLQLALKACASSVSMPLADNAMIALGANNMFNTYPDENPNAGGLGALYPESTPFGFNGGYYYLRLSYDWLWETR